MLTQLQRKSKTLVKYWVFVVIFNISIIVAIVASFFGILSSGKIFNFFETIAEQTEVLWIIPIIFATMFCVVIAEFVLIIKCIKTCSKLLVLNPPLELREKISNQRNRLRWIILINIIYIFLGLHPLLGLILFLINIFLKYKFWIEIGNII